MSSGLPLKRLWQARIDSQPAVSGTAKVAKSRGNIWERDVLGRQPRHCLCTNAQMRRAICQR